MHLMHRRSVTTTPTHLLVKQWREKRGLSQRELGRLVQMEQYTISKIENGVQGMSVVDLEKIVDALGLTMPRFFRGAA